MKCAVVAQEVYKGAANNRIKILRAGQQQSTSRGSARLFSAQREITAPITIIIAAPVEAHLFVGHQRHRRYHWHVSNLRWLASLPAKSERAITRASSGDTRRGATASACLHVIWIGDISRSRPLIWEAHCSSANLAKLGAIQEAG